MRTAAKLALLVPLIAAGAAAQYRHDPLNSQEVDQLRETAQEPIKRLPLMVKFARARMDTLDQLRAQSPTADRAAQIREALKDFTTIVDQLDDNIDDYADRGLDLRKPLKTIVDADTEFQTKLQAWKQAGTSDPAVAKEFPHYSFALDDALDAVKSNLDNAQKTLADQNAHPKELKKAQ